MTTPILTLINDFLATAAEGVARVQKEFGAERVRRGPVRGNFPRFGHLPGGAEYGFHGIGLFVEVDGVRVDFDFGEDGRYDGFDVWRLWRFANQSPAKYPAFLNQEHVSIAVQRLIDDGTAVRSSDPHDRNFYLPGREIKRL